MGWRQRFACVFLLPRRPHGVTRGSRRVRDAPRLRPWLSRRHTGWRGSRRVHDAGKCVGLLSAGLFVSEARRRFPAGNCTLFPPPPARDGAAPDSATTEGAGSHGIPYGRQNMAVEHTVGASGRRRCSRAQRRTNVTTAMDFFVQPALCRSRGASHAHCGPESRTDGWLHPF